MTPIYLVDCTECGEGFEPDRSTDGSGMWPTCPNCQALAAVQPSLGQYAMSGGAVAGFRRGRPRRVTQGELGRACAIDPADPICLRLKALRAAGRPWAKTPRQATALVGSNNSPMGETAR